MDRKIKESINQLVDSKRLDSGLEPVPRAAPIARQRGVAKPEVAQSGGGMSDTLIEIAGTRTYWPAATIMPADGFFFYSVKAVKTLTFNGLTMHLEKPDYGSGEE